MKRSGGEQIDDLPLPDSRIGIRPRFPPGIVWSGLALVFVIVVWRLADLVMLTVLAALLAIMLRAAGDWVARHTGWNAHLALTLVTISIVVGIGGLRVWIGPNLAHETQSLASRIVTVISRMPRTEWLGSWLRHIAAPPKGSASSGLLRPAEAALLLTFHGAANLVVLGVTTLYLAIAPELYISGLVRLSPLKYRQRTREVLAKIGAVLRRWLLGQLADMVVVGVLAAIGLRLGGIPEPYALALIAGLLTFIPYFGAFLAAVPALIVAMTVGWTTAVWAMVVFLICHGVEGYVVAPLVQRHLVELPPALVIVSMTAMGMLFGPLGVMVGGPVAAAGLVLLRELYFVGVLGDHAL